MIAMLMTWLKKSFIVTIFKLPINQTIKAAAEETKKKGRCIIPLHNI